MMCWVFSLFLPQCPEHTTLIQTNICMYYKVNMPRIEDVLAFDISNLTPLMWRMALRFCERVNACPGRLHKKVSKNILNLCFQTLLRFTFILKDTRWVKTQRCKSKFTGKVPTTRLWHFWISNGKTHCSRPVWGVFCLWCRGALRKCTKPASVLGRPQGSGTKLTSGASSRTKPARLSDGEGEARRKAGLVECSESLVLPLLKRGQGAATDWREGCCPQPTEAEGSGENTAELEPSRPIGVVFGVPGRHSSWKSREWTTLSNTPLVLWAHYGSLRKENNKIRHIWLVRQHKC